MTKKSKKILNLMFAGIGLVVVGGAVESVSAQSTDPFLKREWAKPRPTAPAPAPGVAAPAPVAPAPGGQPVAVKPVTKAADKPKPVKPAIVPVGAPPVQERINHFMRLRETAVLNDQPLPKPTLVMTLDELNVTGIFRTPRGYAAMVEAKPIGLSYAIYPGEKVFDGQLVAVEENRLIFRKVTKLSNGKFVTSEASKTLQQYTEQEYMQGTAPVEQTAKTQPESAPAQVVTAPAADLTVKSPGNGVVISPVDEMNNQPVETPKTEKSKSKTKETSAAKKKSVKVAKNKPE